MSSVLRKALATVCSVPATISLVVVRLYQVTLSPDHGPLRHVYPYGYCRHEPTCSEYAIRELQHSSYPLAIGRIIRRVLTCNPWTKVSDAKLRTVIAKTLQNS